MKTETRLFILAGGLGTRLAHITKELPKAMAPIAGRPFLEWQIAGFRKQGFLDLVLLVGHKREHIIEHFGDGSGFGVRIEYSIEDEPLGTGGACLKALAEHPCRHFVLANGDTYFDAPIAELVSQVKAGPSQLWIALKYMKDLSRYGSVISDEQGKVLTFLEKKAVDTEGFINGGIYAGSSELLDSFPRGASSMESQIFPRLIDLGQLYGMPFGDPFIDIGIPGDYLAAQSLLPAWSGAARRRALFLDRDGILIEDVGYVSRIEDIQVIEDCIPVLKQAQERGYLLIVVSNQAGVAKGRMTVEAVESLNAAIKDRFSAHGVVLDSFYYCPFHPQGTIPEFTRESLDRKPSPGMILRAVNDFNIDIGGSMMIGDKDSDVINLSGLRSFLIAGNYEITKTRELTSWERLKSIVV